MLEADASQGKALPSKRRGSEKARMVTFKIFQSEYWPRFPEPLTKRFGTFLFSAVKHPYLPHMSSIDPALVFSEIMGVIKGSESTISQDPHHLSRDQYVNMSVRSYGTFAAHREEIYELFLAYVKRKVELRDYDAADRCVLSEAQSGL